MMSPNRLVAWLKQLPRNVERFYVVILPVGDEPEQVIATYNPYLTEEESNDDNSKHEAFAEQVLHEITEDCNNQEQVTRYDVRAMIGDNVKSKRTVKARPTTDVNDFINDPMNIANSQGAGNNAMQQMVRLNEGMLRMMYQSIGTILEGYRGLLSDQRKQMDEILKRESELANHVLLQIAKESDIEIGETRNSMALAKLTDLAEKIVPHIIQGMPEDMDS